MVEEVKHRVKVAAVRGLTLRVVVNTPPSGIRTEAFHQVSIR